MSHEPTWPHDATMPAGIPPPPLTRREWLVSAAALAAVAIPTTTCTPPTTRGIRATWARSTTPSSPIS